MKCYSLVFNDFSRPIHYLATLSRLLDNCSTCTVCGPNFFFSASGIFFSILFTLLECGKDIRLLQDEGANVSIMW